MANSSELNVSVGLLFTCPKVNSGEGNIRFESGKRMWLAGATTPVVIPGLKKGQEVSISYMTSSSSAARGITPTNLSGTSGFDASTAAQTGKGQVTEDGDVVLAVRNGESTVKAFMRDSRHRVWLIPQNKTLPAIPVAESDDFFIVGVVQGIYRRQPRLVQSKMIDYLTKALDSTGRAGRPQSKTFADIVARSFRDERLSHLHSIMEGRRGKEAAFVMQTAHKICWLTERPTFESIEKEFGPVGAKSNFYRYLQLRMTPDEQKAYFELFREEHNRLRDARLAQLAAEADDEEV
jgi:hypothetical protein